MSGSDTSKVSRREPEKQGEDFRSAATRRFEVSLLIGPCTESESEDFLVAVVGFAENYAEASGVGLGAVGAIHPWQEDADEGASQFTLLAISYLGSGEQHEIRPDGVWFPRRGLVVNDESIVAIANGLAIARRLADA